MILENLWPFPRNGGECTGVRRVSRAGGCWWCNLCLERLLDSDLPVVPHLPNLAHRHTDNNNLSHKTTSSSCPAREGGHNYLQLSEGSFPGGVLPTATFDRESGLGIIGNPPSDQKSPRPGRRQKACTSFPARCFLIQADNNGCQCALNEAQSCLSNPEKKLWNK